MSLFMDLAPVRPKVGLEIPFELTTDALPLLHGEWQMNAPLLAKGVIHPEMHTLLVDGTITVSLQTPCARCLQPVELPLVLPFSEKLIYVLDVPHVLEEGQKLTDLEDDYWVFDKLLYDFEPLIVDEILAALPARILCKKDCKGLCEHCGKNLNIETCACDHKVIDPRWARLQELQDGEV